MSESSSGLSKVNDAIKRRFWNGSTCLVDYQPGNYTRYIVQFSHFPDSGFAADVMMNVVNFRRSMELSGPQYAEYSIGYMQEKLGLNVGDLIPLAELTQWYFNELDTSQGDVQ